MTALEKKPLDINTLGPRITVIGVGGAGNNAVNNMIRYNLQGVDYIACNTDAQHLQQSLVPQERRVQLGLEVTQGLGAGSRPDVGRSAAEESLDDVIRNIKGSNMVFVTAGMGGGTGTGAAPVIAQAAREMGILTVGVVTKPFSFEGPHRMKMAEKGVKELEQYVDTLIIIPNQNLFRIATDKTTFADAFKMADDVLYSGVRGVTDLMIMPGLVNLDFADIRAVMTEMGKAMMGTGEASGDGRAIAAAEAAISNPLLDDVSMRGAKGVLINITGGMDMTLFEVDEAANRIREEIDSDTSIETNIIFGSTFDENLNGSIRVSVVATGIDSEEMRHRLAEIATQRAKEEAATRAAMVEDNESLHLDQGTDAQTPTYQDPYELSGELSGQTEQTQGAVGVGSGDFDEEDVNVIRIQGRKGAFQASHADEDEEENFYADPRSRTKKRGFFGRFMDTLSGKDEEEDFHAENARLSSKKGQVNAHQQSAPVSEDLFADVDDVEIQDVPAYLRRKSK